MTTSFDEGQIATHILNSGKIDKPALIDGHNCSPWYALVVKSAGDKS
jgi:hypothetical protein